VNCITVAAMFLLLHFTFIRQFGDLLVLLILLCYFHIIVNPNFGKNYKGIIAAAFLGGIAFYAKYYSFYFILIHLPIMILLSEKKNVGKYFKITALKKILISITIFLFTCSFWFVALHHKYGHFVLGQKNVTGTLIKIYNPEKKLVQPPLKSDYALFDDISNVNSIELTPFTNKQLFIIQSKIIISNLYLLIGAFNEFSILFWGIILVSLFWLNNKKKYPFSHQNILTMLSMISIWSIGFLLFSVQSRFFWIVDMLVLCMAGVLLSDIKNLNFVSKKQWVIGSAIVIFSFCLYPIMELKNNYGKGKNLFDIAQVLRKNEIKGSLLAGIQSDYDYSNSIIINFLTKSKFYGVYKRNYSSEDILFAIRDFSINYFIYYYTTQYQKESFLESNLPKHAQLVYPDIYPGIIVLKFSSVK
jgi:hypothetical protein